MATNTTNNMARPINHETPPSTEPTRDPFQNMFDGEGTEDEWWDEEETIESSSPEASRRNNIHTAEASRPISWGVNSRPVARVNTRKGDRRMSVQKPTRDKSKGRQRKQNAKAGIKVVTNFPKHQPVAPTLQQEAARPMPQMGCFVDLAALKALSGEATPQATTGFWKARKTKHSAKASLTSPNNPGLALPNSGANLKDADSAFDPRTEDSHIPSPLKLGDDLSPNDRPIFIGISIPSASLAQHTLSPQTALSDNGDLTRAYDRRTPTNLESETPTIIITPAQQSSVWSPLDSSTGAYQESTYHSDPRSTNRAPPLPTMPASFLEEERQRVAAQRSYFSPDSDDATNWGDSPSKSRVVSSCTIFEEDESPILIRTAHATPISAGPRVDRHASMSTLATQRRSRGWWNYITTPFLTRSNTVATRDIENETPPALPSLAVAAAKVQDVERDRGMWEKQFSPLTPATSTTIASDSWWNVDAKPSPVVQETRHKVQTSTSTLPIILSESAGLATVTISSIASADVAPLSPVRTSNSITQLPLHDIAGQSTSGTSDERALQSNNPFIQIRLSGPSPAVANQSNTAHEVTSMSTPRTAILPTPSEPIASAEPPPPYTPSPERLRYQAVFPPDHQGLGIQQPLSPGPISPGLQEIMSSRDDIPLSTVPLTPPRRPINLNSGYPSELPVRQNGGQFITAEVFEAPPTRATKAEAKRQRYEKEDAIARRAGGWWRGRGCIPERGCYGRSGAEGRKRRRWYLALIVGFLIMIALIVALATTLHRKSNTVIEPSQWLNLTGFPPIYLGVSTVIAPQNLVSNTGCVFPATQWSCDLPKELQASVAPNAANQPNFFLYVQWDNSSSANATFANVTSNPNLVTRDAVFNPVSAGQFIKSMILKARDIVTFVSFPAPPAYAEEYFLGNTTDGIVSSNKAGEPTPFYMSFLSSANATLSKRQLFERDTSSNSSDPFPNVTSVIPSPSVNSDGTAAPANLLPFPTQQPIKLYDRGLPTEHYGFYTYYDRSIFLKSLALLNQSNIDNGEVPDDENGGATESEAMYRCTWSQTRFLVQMWTRMNATSQLLNSTSHSSTLQPGSFPYPITITTDRHGGEPSLKMVYCYTLDDREGIVAGSGTLQSENRGFGGVDINPAPTFFSNSSDPSLGGYDGGTGGCSCQWSNFQNVVAA